MIPRRTTHLRIALSAIGQALTALDESGDESADVQVKRLRVRLRQHPLGGLAHDLDGVAIPADGLWFLLDHDVEAWTEPCALHQAADLHAFGDEGAAPTRPSAIVERAILAHLGEEDG